MGNQRDTAYYDLFVTMVDYSCRSAQLLDETLRHFQPGELRAKLDELHQLEHSADMCKHDMMHQLAREFITPIEREDIIGLAQEIDEVTDNIEDVLLRIFMYNITEIRPEALEFTSVVVSCCSALKTAMEEFHNFRKSTTIHGSIVEINRLEEVGDKLYVDSMRKLYTDGSTPVEMLTWSETFDRLEGCCDACEHAADVVESIIMKNS